MLRGISQGLTGSADQPVVQQDETRVLQIDRGLSGLVVYPFSRAQRVEFNRGLRQIAGKVDVTGFAKKVLLRKAAEPLVPHEIVHGKKRGFSIPAAAWLRGDLEPFARETLSAERLRAQGFFEPRVVARIIDDHVGGREDLSRQLWGLLAFTLWHERHVQRTPASPTTTALQAAVA